MFYVRDETLGKDRSRSRPQVMATRRNTALSLLRITGSTIIPRVVSDETSERGGVSPRALTLENT